MNDVGKKSPNDSFAASFVIEMCGECILNRLSRITLFTFGSIVYFLECGNYFINKTVFVHGIPFLCFSFFLLPSACFIRFRWKFLFNFCASHCHPGQMINKNRLSVYFTIRWFWLREMWSMDERPFFYFAINLLRRKFPLTKLMWVLCSLVLYVFRKKALESFHISHSLSCLWICVSSFYWISSGEKHICFNVNLLCSIERYR